MMPLPEPQITKYQCCLCSCLWRRNSDRSWSLYDAHQKSCAVCDNSPEFMAVIDPIVESAIAMPVNESERARMLVAEVEREYPLVGARELLSRIASHAWKYGYAQAKEETLSPKKHALAHRMQICIDELGREPTVTWELRMKVANALSEGLALLRGKQ